MHTSLIGFVFALSALTAGAICERSPALSSPAPSPCEKNLIVNGSFEEGTEPGSYTTIKAGSNDLEGWTVTHGTVDIVGSLWKASDGGRSIDLDGVTFGGISQTFETKAGKTYVVTFAFAGNGYGAPIVKKMQVAAADQSATFQYDLRNRPASIWEDKSWSFAAKTDSTTLSFDSLDTENGYFGPVIDNVRVQEACK